MRDAERRLIVHDLLCSGPIPCYAGSLTLSAIKFQSLYHIDSTHVSLEIYKYAHSTIGNTTRSACVLGESKCGEGCEVPRHCPARIEGRGVESTSRRM